MLPSLQLQIV